jgi:hypothetical protein
VAREVGQDAACGARKAVADHRLAPHPRFDARHHVGGHTVL